MAPNRPNIISDTDMIGAEKLLSRKKPSCSIGWVLCRSHKTKATRTATPPTPVPATSADDQPYTGASMMAHSSNPSPATDSNDPTRSGLFADGSLESGTSGRARAKPTAATGTLIKNTDPHQ